MSLDDALDKLSQKAQKQKAKIKAKEAQHKKEVNPAEEKIKKNL